MLSTHGYETWLAHLANHAVPASESRMALKRGIDG